MRTRKGMGMRNRRDREERISEYHVYHDLDQYA